MKRSILSVGLSLFFLGGFPTGASADESVTVPVTTVAYYADHTVHDGIRDYPVGDVVSRWNRNGHVILTKVPDCVGYNPCVVINEYYPTDLDTSFYNVAGWADPADGIIGIVNKPYTTYRFRWTVTCHELGHYLGVGHSSHGCMTAYIYPLVQNWVGAYNRALVKQPSQEWYKW